MLKRYIRNAIQQLSLLPYSFAAAPADFEVLPRGAEGNSRSYQKFIILGHQRYGSSMLISTLRTHPQVVGFGELFMSTSVGFNVEGYDNNSAKILALRNKYPIEFLNSYIFSSYDEKNRAVGFKFFPEHIEMSPRFRCIWQWLEETENLKIIHLTRKNLLAAYASLLIAMKYGKYGIRDKSERSTATITIDPKKCLAEFQNQKASDEVAERSMRHHEIFNIVYEDLAAAPHIHLKKIQQFLGIDKRELTISTVKQETRFLSEVIVNYEELRIFFRETDWEYLFDM